MKNDILREVGHMQIKYSPDVDVLLIKLKEGRPTDSEDISDCIIVHYSRNREPLEIEILDASRLVQLNDVDISWKELIKPIHISNNKKVKVTA